MSDEVLEREGTYQRVRRHLSTIYPNRLHELDELTTRAIRAVGLDPTAMPGSDTTTPGQPSGLPGAEEVVLITYGDTFVTNHQPHLRSLAEFCNRHFADVFSTVHVLPFYPSSSDGGFSVLDYRAVDPALGDWSDLAALPGEQFMLDLVCNHGSAQSDWFADFVAGRSPARDFYVTADPTDDLSAVTRPRTHRLLLPVDTVDGTRHVWATFSHDQVDFDFANPDVLIEFCSILGFYLAQGASRVRLDAIAYLWKRIGTSCVHLPETHQIIKLMRALVEAVNPTALMITETNVPHDQNIEYFGAGDEAHVIYNFTLAPLIIWSMITGTGTRLSNWLADLTPPPTGTTFLNFIASHDGIGLRPVEDLISSDELAPLVQAGVNAGGDVSQYAAAEGPRPYELNVSLANLLAGIGGDTADRFIAAHALMLAVQGIPAIYVHSMLSSTGDHQAVAQSGHKRDINRAHLPLDQAHAQIADGWRSDVLSALSHLIRVRRSQPAFAPEAIQVVINLGPQLVAIRRGTGATQVLAVHNVSDQPCTVELPTSSGLHDLISGADVERSLTLTAWQSVWLV